jgi:serine/threonine protein kinase
MMSLEIVEGPDRGRSFPLCDGKSLIIGRGSQSHTQIQDPRISRIHCRIVWEKGQPILVDESGSAGTHVQGQPITRVPLAAGMLFQIGGTLFRLYAPGSSSADFPTVSVPAPTPASKAPRLTQLVGRTLGRYQLDKIITTTQSGMLFRAHDEGKSEVVAVKVLAPDLTHGDEQKDRFVRAMRTMLPVRHANIVRLHDAGKNGPFCWAAMDFIDGESLLQLIDRMGIDGMLDWREAWRVAVHICRALQFADEHKIVHRNVTPTNILRRRTDKVCLLGDLMLAKALEGAHSVQITRPGQLVGEVGYMAPERTYADGVVDIRSDMYALGATLYALLAGQPPFGDHSLTELVRQVREDTPRPPREFQYSVHTVFETLVLKLMAKRPDARYQTPVDLLRDLERVGRFANLEADDVSWL